MRHFFRVWYRQWQELLKDKNFRLSLVGGLTIFVITIYINFRATLYADQIAVLSVGDLILDHIPTLDLSLIYVFGAYLAGFIAFIYPFFFRPELLPFSAKTISAFYLIRSGFITLTHLGAPAGYFRLPQLEDQPGLFKLFYTNDLFFSGHTGFPFLLALLFWEHKLLRWFLLGLSIAQAITVLFMHVHYSIDVFSAYFITYTIYVLSDKIFNPLNHSFLKIVQAIKEKMKPVSS